MSSNHRRIPELGRSCSDALPTVSPGLARGGYGLVFIEIGGDNDDNVAVSTGSCHLSPEG